MTMITGLAEYLQKLFLIDAVNIYFVGTSHK